MTLQRSRAGSAAATRRILFVLATCLACALPAQAQSVINLTGDIEVAAIPPSLAGGQFISQTHIRLLEEGPGVVTAGMPGFPYDGAIHDPSLPVAPGDNTFGNAITTPYTGPGLPALGTQVHSVLLHFDPDLVSLPFSLTEGIALSATITFDRQILGVYVTSQASIATDPIFDPGGVTYSTNAARDLEFNYDGDAYLVSPDRYTLSLTMFGHNGGHFDEARIILAMAPTSVVPDVVGQTQAQATSSLEALGFLAATTLQASATVPVGEVISQNPVGGSQASDGSTVSLVVSAGEPENLLERGSSSVGGAPITVALNRTFIDPVVVASVQYADNVAPVVARVSNVTPTSFDVRLQNPSDGPVATDVVHYLVVETGVWTLDGFNFEAQTYVSSVTDSASSWVGEARSYGQSYANPVVLGQVMTENDPDWSAFWARGGVREDPPSSSTLVTGKMVGEDPDATRADETIGIIVFEAGHGMLAGAEFEAALGPDSVEGVDDSPPYAYPFDTAFSEEPQVVLVSMSGVDGINGGWAQAHGATLATTTSLFVSIDEDQVADPERSHISEQVAYAAFGNVPAVSVPASTGFGLALLSAVVAALGVRRTRRA